MFKIKIFYLVCLFLIFLSGVACGDTGSSEEIVSNNSGINESEESQVNSETGNNSAESDVYVSDEISEFSEPTVSLPFVPFD